MKSRPEIAKIMKSLPQKPFYPPLMAECTRRTFSQYDAARRYDLMKCPSPDRCRVSFSSLCWFGNEELSKYSNFSCLKGQESHVSMPEPSISPPRRGQSSMSTTLKPHILLLRTAVVHKDLFSSHFSTFSPLENKSTRRFAVWWPRKRFTAYFFLQFCSGFGLFFYLTRFCV